MWQKIIETALLGIEKKPLNPDVLPNDIQDIFKQSNSSPEHAFLESAALYHYYLESGQYPPVLNCDVDDRIIEEALTPASQEVNEIFKYLEKVNGRFKEKLFNQWLDLLIKKQQIVSPEILISLLLEGNNFSDLTKNKILKVIGNKGSWILTLHDGFKYKQSMQEKQIWTEGNANERKIAFCSILEVDTSQAITLLQSTWTQESVVNKKVFLELLKEFKSKAVIDFAQNLYENEFSYNPKEKKTEKECRKILAEILLANSETSLFQYVHKNLLNYYNAEKKKSLLSFVSSKNTAEYLLPEVSDIEFWSPEIMEQKFGVEVKYFDLSLYNTINQFWLSFFIEVLPVEAWYNGTVNSYSDVLNCFLTNEKFTIKTGGKVQLIYQKAFIRNVENFNNGELAGTLLSRVVATEALPLLKYLKLDDFEQFVRKNKYFADAEILQNGPYSLELSWSVSFSDYILSNICEYSLQPNASNLAVLGQLIAQFINAEAYPYLQKYYDKMSGTGIFNYLKTSVFEPVDTVLQIRRLIKSANN